MKSTLSIKTLVFLSLLLCACQPSEEKYTLDGTYEQIGYGRIVVIDSNEFVLYDRTSKACLPILEGDISIYGGDLYLENDSLKLKDGINLYQFKRISEAPANCQIELTEAQSLEPILNFEVLAEIFDEHYAYFELRNVNWDSLKTATRNKISKETSYTELYYIFEDMLDHFNDGHIGLDAINIVPKVDEDNDVEDNEVQQEYGDLDIAQIMAEHYVSEGLKSSRSELVKWGMMEKDIAYMQVNLMMGHGTITSIDSTLTGIPYLQAYFNALEYYETSADHTKMEVEGIKDILTQAMEELKDAEALVLDVRFNAGGKDEVALEIMSTFNDQRQKVFHKKARMGDGFTPITNVYLEAKPEAYTKPVFILTSRESASATEIMVLSSLSLDHTYRVGNHTEGVFSDVMDKVLPNGWAVGLSNEVYQDNQGNSYEHIGIAPDVSLGYADDTQVFYNYLANNLEQDKQRIVKIIQKYINSEGQ